MPLLLMAGGAALLVAGYCLGAKAGYVTGHSFARAQTDLEWARMLENGMVGPGSTRSSIEGI